MIRSFTITTTAALLIGAAPALAGGVVTPAPQAPTSMPTPTPTWDFTGFSAGVQLGYGDVSTNVEGDEIGFAGSSDELEGDGAVYGLKAYYDRELGGFIVGGGVQYDWSDIDLEVDGDDAQIAVDNILRVGARAGISSNRNWYYATAGYARLSVDDDFLGETYDSGGYFVGLGYEVFLTQSLTAGAEVLYHDFSDFDDLDIDDVEADVTTATLSVNFRF